MSVKGFLKNGKIEKYDFYSLDNIDGIGHGGGGAPSVVDMLSKMVDRAAIYIYGGTEPGYTSGNWYYYSKAVSAWVSGGVYTGISSEDLEQTLSAFLANHSVALENADAMSY